MHIVALAAGPAHALYFSCYERIKLVFSGSSQVGHNPVANGLAGCFATLLHDALMVPADGNNKLFFLINKKVISLNFSYQTTSSGLRVSLFRCNRLSA